jgi:DNA-binding response OmpR family regulator
MSTKRILMVELNNETARLIKGWLKSAGFEVITARTFPQACQNDEPFGLIIGETRFGPTSGKDLVQKVRDLQQVPVRVLLLTYLGGWIKESDDTFVLVKPIREGRLLETVRKALTGSR